MSKNRKNLFIKNLNSELEKNFIKPVNIDLEVLSLGVDLAKQPSIDYPTDSNNIKFPGNSDHFIDSYSYFMKNYEFKLPCSSFENNLLSELINNFLKQIIIKIPKKKEYISFDNLKLRTGQSDEKIYLICEKEILGFINYNHKEYSLFLEFTATPKFSKYFT